MIFAKNLPPFIIYLIEVIDKTSKNFSLQEEKKVSTNILLLQKLGLTLLRKTFSQYNLSNYTCCKQGTLFNSCLHHIIKSEEMT